MLQPIPPEVLKAVTERQRPIRAEQFAEQALRAVSRNKGIIVIPSRWKIAWWLYRLSPRLGFYLGAKGLEIMKRAIERSLADPPLQPTGAASSVCASARPPEGGPGA